MERVVLKAQIGLFLFILFLVGLRFVLKSLPEWLILVLVALGALFYLGGPEAIGPALVLLIMLWGMKIMFFGPKGFRRRR